MNGSVFYRGLTPISRVFYRGLTPISYDPDFSCPDEHLSSGL